MSDFDEDENEDLVTCDDCGEKYPSEGYCTRCDEFNPPVGTECEFCDKPATSYVQDHPVCDDHYEDAYPID
ncbi:hypothetical protein [Lelliottia aquatilis]|uniref:hypothetical protein n=1 Tax=Lelliottia aquatilis TaxID=2080838 RepID=UPI00192C2F9C|nr:hypothetical protein [Lelliottia aquatilis]MBL5882572.1 hypothetical protein [Lelliottia aquatilis]